MSLPPSFFERAFTHRALHNLAEGRPENSVEAIQAAIEGGYGIEIDVQLSADGAAIVFHDYDLARLTGEPGLVRERSAQELGKIPLIGGEAGIPTLGEVLAQVVGKVPLLIEIKDQDGKLGPNVGALEEAVAHALDGYGGDAAVMSFNPHSVAAMARLAPNVPRGLTTGAFRKANWPRVALNPLIRLRHIETYERVGACFISHNVAYLRSRHVRNLKARGAAIFCWTVKNAAQEERALKIADNITFEGYPRPSALNR